MHARTLPLAAIVIGVLTFCLPIGVSSFGQPALDSALADYRWRSIGPGSIGGRITDVEALETDFRQAVVASASGGVWKTQNAGTTWTPIFDRYASASIGDIAIFQPNPTIIWVGTGEANNRNSVAWGDGVYKSEDGGTTFTHVGLKDTYQIARIVTHPKDPNVVYVAAVGNLWGATGTRGLFKTSDGGHTWQKLTNGLPDDVRTGATEIVMDRSRPDTLYVAMYERLRRPWRFDSGGPNGGIFKSTDGGRSWRTLTKGLPEGPTGRIGLDLFQRNPRILMAIVEHGYNPGETIGGAGGRGGRGGTPNPDYADMTKPGTGVYRSEDGGETWRFMNRYNNRPFYYSQIRINPTNDKQVYVLTATFQWSEDGGRTITRAPAPFGGSYDHHAMWIDPNDGSRFYLGKDKGLTLTFDHGANFVYFENLPVAQFYAVGVDMRDPYAIYGGLQDNGSFATVSFSRDVLGIRSDSSYKMHWGDGMHAAVDPNDWRTVYSSAENASFRLFDPLTRTDTNRRPTPANIQNFREATGVDPTSPGAAVQLRFNWQSPFFLSPHDPTTIYLAGNRVLRSRDRGVTWTIISPDLSRAIPDTIAGNSGGITPDNSGAERYATVVSLAESPRRAGLLWAGTDDGNVHVSRNGGETWTRVDERIAGVPAQLWVSDVEPSAGDPETAYVTFDGHRSDNRAPWLFKTTDGGQTWTNLSAGLAPEQPIYVLTESSRNPNLLFVGTEFGVQVSRDAGRTWASFGGRDAFGMPTVAVHDLVIHPRDRDLVAGTHGRGIYIMDDISALEEWTPDVAARAVHVFRQRPATRWVDQSRTGQLGEHTFAGENPPSVAPVAFGNRDRARLQNTPIITLGFGPSASGTATLEIVAPDGARRTLTVEARPGIVRYLWDGQLDPPGGPAATGRGAAAAPGGGRGGRGGGTPAAFGTYQLRLTLGGATAAGVLQLREDPILTGR
ncbi:MAG: hypothetical protein NUW22_12065 [Acidobacteria bacterium]|nr:hypothetical protein [Acidobacteriota bacterium]